MYSFYISLCSNYWNFQISFTTDVTLIPFLRIMVDLLQIVNLITVLRFNVEHFNPCLQMYLNMCKMEAITYNQYVSQDMST